MKRIMTALAATTAFAVTPALAHQHMDGEKDMADKHEMKSDKHDMSSEKMSGHMDKSAKMEANKYIQDTTGAAVTQDEMDARNASQLFLAIDTENDGLISKSEWTEWQNRSESETKLFADYDADSDGDIELSEYLETYDNS